MTDDSMITKDDQPHAILPQSYLWDFSKLTARAQVNVKQTKEAYIYDSIKNDEIESYFCFSNT
jgi:hypothetical protein